MRANIARANDVILAEAAVFALAKRCRGLRRKSWSKKRARIAVAEGKPLIEVVRDLSQGR